RSAASNTKAASAGLITYMTARTATTWYFPFCEKSGKRWRRRSCRRRGSIPCAVKRTKGKGKGVMARFKKAFFRAFAVLFAVGLLGLAVSLVINGYIKNQTEEAIIYSKTDRSASISEDDAKALRDFDADCILV